MNRSVRNNIAKVTRRTVTAIRQNAYELSKVLEAAKFGEEDKRDNMPESFSDCSNSNNTGIVEKRFTDCFSTLVKIGELNWLI